MRYPIVIHKEPKSCYGVTVPDLPGCFSAGATIDEALTMTREAILGHVEALVDNGMEVPRPLPIDRHRTNPDYADAFMWGVVDVDLSEVPGKAVRINISIQERVLNVVDQYAASSGETRSGLLQRAALQYISEHPSSPTRKPRAPSRRPARHRPANRK